jgi:glycine cleavage system regulatory protein
MDLGPGLYGIKKLSLAFCRQKDQDCRQNLDGGFLMETLQARFEVIGFENPELGKLVQMALARQGASIASVQVAPLSAPMTGDHLMQATVIAFLPPECSLRTAEHAIEEISDDLSVVALAA